MLPIYWSLRFCKKKLLLLSTNYAVLPTFQTPVFLYISLLLPQFSSFLHETLHTYFWYIYENKLALRFSKKKFGKKLHDLKIYETHILKIRAQLKKMSAKLHSDTFQEYVCQVSCQNFKNCRRSSIIYQHRTNF